MAKYSTSKKEARQAAKAAKQAIIAAKKVAPIVKEITIADILEDAKDGVLKDKSIKAVKKLTKK